MILLALYLPVLTIHLSQRSSIPLWMNCPSCSNQNPLGNNKPNEDRYMSWIKKMLMDRDESTPILLKHSFEQKIYREIYLQERILIKITSHDKLCYCSQLSAPSSIRESYIPSLPGLSVGRIQQRPIDFQDGHVMFFDQWNMRECNRHLIRTETLNAFQWFIWPHALVFSVDVTVNLGPRRRKPGAQGKPSTADSWKNYADQ